MDFLVYDVKGKIERSGEIEDSEDSIRYLLYSQCQARSPLGYPNIERRALASSGSMVSSCRLIIGKKECTRKDYVNSESSQIRREE